jgi:hypothetical protein
LCRQYDDEAGARRADPIIHSLETLGIEHRTIRFTDVGAKDVSEFLEIGHSERELVAHIGWLGGSYFYLNTTSTIEYEQA